MVAAVTAIGNVTAAIMARFVVLNSGDSVDSLVSPEASTNNTRRHTIPAATNNIIHNNDSSQFFLTNFSQDFLTKTLFKPPTKDLVVLMIGEKRAVLLLLLILCIGLVVFPSVEIVKAEETVYLRADGTVEGTDKIRRDGYVYTFTADLSGEIVVERDDVVIDGANYVLQGNGTGAGINLVNRSKVVIKNLQISGFNAGVGLYDAYNNTIVGNLLVSNLAAVSITDSNNNSITENTMIDNEHGIYLFSSYNNSIYGNSFINNTQQVFDNVWNNPWLPQLLSVNFWDNGTTGNYWSHYNSTDTDGDGIGDSSFVLYENNQDNYPLIEPVPAIPEFPSWAILPLLLVASLAALIYRKKLYRKPN